MFKQ